MAAGGQEQPPACVTFRVGYFSMKIAIALLAFSAAAGATPTLTANSYGQITFGEKVDVIEARLKERVPATTRTDERHCRQVEFKTYPGMRFMVEDGVITRAETTSPVATSIGFTVGAPISVIKDKYPSVDIEPHHYVAGGHYLTFKVRNGEAAILMEEEAGKVTHVRGGLMPSVQYVEGCL